jgi:hypothetical protein
MRLALVVEGSQVFHARTQHDLLAELWQTAIPGAIGCVQPDCVFGINKGSIAAMRLKDTKLRRTTSISEPLDQILERHRRVHRIDCFLVVWDLIPPWDRQAKACRWDETKAFYEGLSLSAVLDAQFCTFAKKRFAELRARAHAGQRLTPPRLAPAAVFAVCMDPIFESGFMNEKAMKKCLGVSGRRTAGWPTGWDPKNVNAEKVVEAAVDAARESFPNSPLCRKIRDGYAVLKTEWGLYFAKSSLFDQTLRTSGYGHRLAELKPR